MATPEPLVTIVDVTDATTFALVPPCADPGFDHRSCDYWEDADRGSKAARLDWFTASTAPAPEPAPRSAPANPFLADLEERKANPFAPPGRGGGSANPFLTDDADEASSANPFAPPPPRRAGVDDDAPRKLRLLGRGLGVAGSYAKVLLLDEVAAAYCQFGPLSAYPRAMQTRELYPALPDAPLPAVITCIATTPAARGAGHARQLVEAVLADLNERGFAAVETYPDVGARPDATSAATPAFWASFGFRIAAADDRFPVMRHDFA